MATQDRVARNDWIKVSNKCSLFWARTSAANLEKDEVHRIFGVDSMYDYEGSFEQAIKIIEDWQILHPPDEAQPPQAPTPAPPAPEPAPDPEQAAEQARALFEASQVLPEAGALAFTKFQTPGGFVWCVTFRAGLPPDLATGALTQIRQQIQLFEKGAKAHRWLPVSNGHDITSTPAPAQSPAPPQAGTAPPVVEGHQGFPASPPQERSGNGASGTALLRKITVDADGRVEFYVGKFKYPFKDGRGAEVVAGLFDEELGWMPEHFKPGAKYEADALAGLQVDWEKPGKYYDVIRVHR